jgi:hypothetical protein
MKCNEVAGRRLPSIRELKLAYEAGITKSWQKDGYDYWSSTPYNAESYNGLSVLYGYTSFYNRYKNYGLHCRR